MGDMILSVSVSSSHVDSLNSFLLAANTRPYLTNPGRFQVIWALFTLDFYFSFSCFCGRHLRWSLGATLQVFCPSSSFHLPASLLAFLWSAINYINGWLAAVPILNLQGAEYAPVFREVLLAPPISSSLHQAWLAWAASCPTMHFIFPFLPCNKTSLTQTG